MEDGKLALAEFLETNTFILEHMVLLLLLISPTFAAVVIFKDIFCFLTNNYL